MKKIMYLLSIAIVFTLLGCGAKATSPVRETIIPVTVPAPIPKKSNYAIGETFKLDNLQYKVNSIRMSEGETGQFSKPKDGKNFLFIDMTVENQGNEDAIVSSMISFKLVDNDGQGQEFSITAMAETRGKMDATLTPGRKVTGELGYEVLKGPQVFELEITPSPIDPKIAVVEIPVK